MKLYTVKQVSQMLGIPESTIRGLVYRKMIKVANIPNHTLILASEIEKIKKWRARVPKAGRPKNEAVGGTL